MPSKDRRQYSDAPGLPDLLRCGREAVADCLTRLCRRIRMSAALPHVLAVDGTCGNGHDTLFLAATLNALLPPQSWSVFSFDVQPAALTAARRLLRENGFPEKETPAGREEGAAYTGKTGSGVRFFLQGHERLAERLAHENGERAEYNGALLAVGMYNLGFLPRSDKRLVTKAPETLASLSQAAGLLMPGGLLAVHAYGGHAGGRQELDAVAGWFAGLPFAQWHAGSYALCNKPRNPETLFLAARRPCYRC